MSAPWFLGKLRTSFAEKKAEGVSPEQVAVGCGISKGMLYQYLAGDSTPSVDRFRQMAHYFGWPIPDWMEDDAASGDSRWFTQTASDLQEPVAVPV